MRGTSKASLRCVERSKPRQARKFSPCCAARVPGSKPSHSEAASIGRTCRKSLRAPKWQGCSSETFPRMSQIEVRELRKVYRVHEREAGAKASIRSLFMRKYKEVEAVKGVSFSLEAGEIVGFLGPNGAG